MDVLSINKIDISEVITLLEIRVKNLSRAIDIFKTANLGENTITPSMREFVNSKVNSVLELITEIQTIINTIPTE